MRRILVLAVMALFICSQAFAFQIGSVQSNLGTSISADTVNLYGGVKALGNNLPTLSIWVTPDIRNSGLVYIGSSSLTGTLNNIQSGYYLSVTGGSVKIEVDNLNKIYVTSDTVRSNDKVSFIAVKQ